MGKILLAGMRPAEARRILARRLEVFTPHTITDPVALERELDRVRRRGYALDREEITRGIVCVAAPIRNAEGDTVAAISVAFPAYISRERGMRGDIRVVTRCAAVITAALQGSGGLGARSGGHARPVGPWRSSAARAWIRRSRGQGGSASGQAAGTICGVRTPRRTVSRSR